MTLKEIGSKLGADKNIHTELLGQYEKYLPKKCNIFLEIGCLYGASARMFKKWYGDETEYHLLDLFGDDFLPEDTIKKEGFITYKGSQSDLTLLNKLPNNINVVSEDCSHHSDEQIITFKYLFKEKLASGGLYIIEDCYGHFDEYWRRGVISNPDHTILPTMQRFINGENMSGQFFTNEESEYFKENIADVKIHDNITLFIWKK